MSPITELSYDLSSAEPADERDRYFQQESRDLYPPIKLSPDIPIVPPSLPDGYGDLFLSPDVETSGRSIAGGTGSDSPSSETVELFRSIGVDLPESFD